MLEQFQKQFTAFIVSICILACGGGGGGDDDVLNPPSDNTLNAGLTGSLLFVYEDSGYLLNASTGRHTKIPNTNWDRYNNIFPKPDSASYYVTPAFKNNTEFLIEARNCDHSFGDILTCIKIQGYDGVFHEGFSTWDKVLGGELSPDRQFIALFRMLSEDWLEIYSRTGDLISSSQVDFNHFNWLTDGSIVYVDHRSFVFTNKNSTNSEYILTLPRSLEPNAVIGRISISPDESRIVFDLITNSVKPYIMNIDGTEIRQLADSPSGSNYINISQPQWSPDGRWILLKQGASAVSTPTAGTRPSLYLVPSQDLGKVFILSKSDSERSQEVVKFYRYDNVDNTGFITNSALSETDLYWIP